MPIPFYKVEYFGEAANWFRHAGEERNRALRSGAASGSCNDRRTGQADQPVRINKHVAAATMRLKIVAGVGQVEAFIDQRKIRHDVVENRVIEGGPIGE